MIWDLAQSRPSGGYRMVMSDPPWHFEVFNEETGIEKSPQNHYDCMSLDDIKALPVAQLAARNSILWLWTTGPMMPQALEVLPAWGFEYVTMGSWAKKTRERELKCGCMRPGKYRWGNGYVLRTTCEPFIIGRRGKPRTSSSVPSGFDGLARQHSRKPDEAYALAEKMIPDVPRLDMFSRQDRPGWDSWGLETGKFNEGEQDGNA